MSASNLSNMNELSSNNFECGFYPIISNYNVYRVAYFLFIILFLIFELELLLVMFIMFGYQSFINVSALLIILIFLLFDILYLHIYWII